MSIKEELSKLVFVRRDIYQDISNCSDPSVKLATFKYEYTATLDVRLFFSTKEEFISFKEEIYELRLNWKLDLDFYIEDVGQVSGSITVPSFKILFGPYNEYVDISGDCIVRSVDKVLDKAKSVNLAEVLEELRSLRDEVASLRRLLFGTGGDYIRRKVRLETKKSDD